MAEPDERGRVTFSRIRDSQRASWWITFVLLAALGVLWALASAPTGAPDEGDHVANAVAVARGQLVGDALTAAQKATIIPGRGNRSAYRAVDVPALYGAANTGCFAFQREVSARCFHYGTSERTAPVLIPVTWYPPAFYAFVGLVARPFPAGDDSLYVMRFASALLMAALLASAVASLRRSASPRLGLIGFLAALTPMVLFFGASVNPSGVEIVAALALWASGAVLVREVESTATVDPRLVLRAGVAAAVLALSRQDSPLWLGLILLTLVGVAGWGGLRVLWSSTRVRIWSLVVLLCTAAQVAWVLGVGTLSQEHSVFARGDLSSSAALRAAVGRSFEWYHQLIGWFGWLDTPSPMLTVVLWTLVVGGLVLLATALGRRRWAVATLAVLAGTVVIPVVLEYVQSRGWGAGHWQGRYALPFAVGVPLLAALAIESDGFGERISSGLFVPVAAVGLAVAQFGAFAQNLRRYTVGYDGKVLFFSDPRWSPPLGALTLVVVFVVVLAALVVWLLGGRSRAAAPVVGLPSPGVVP